MRLAIEHTTIYRYSRPAFLEPHILRLCPRHDVTQHVESHELVIDPTPAGLTPCVDLDGDTTHTAWFEGLHATLRVTSRATVRTLRSNAFDFLLIDPATMRLPLVYSGDGAVPLPLQPYVTRDKPDVQATRFAQDVLAEVNGDTLTFLSLLNQRVYDHIKQEVRADGPPLPLAQILDERRGACRDLSAVFIAACRWANLPARFVSGYAAPASEAAETQYIHAWVEVYLPGAGWRGYDPSQGAAVTDGHVAVSASALAESTLPVVGSFRGTGVSATMTAEVIVTIL